MIDKTLVISFSGGRTSGYMTKKLLETKKKWKEVLVLFANTGQEHEKTLEFISFSPSLINWFLYSFLDSLIEMTPSAFHYWLNVY